jgi:predicted RNase H-like nuclease (RuvC/YqgF family)
MSDLAELQHQKSVLEREHSGIVSAIHELRARAKQKSIEAATTRSPLPETEIAFWRNGIAKLQTELMAVQTKLAAVNKELRKAQADQPIKTLSQLPRVAVKEESAGVKPNGAVIQAPGDIKEGYALFLQFFRQLVVENLDPRLVEVFEKDAHGLVNDYRRMHKEKS